MNYGRTLLLIPALALGSYSARSQDVVEAYNLSNLTVQGTARSMGFGNALGSIGADYSAASVNPAGLGVYRSSEFTFTPSLRMNSSSSDYLGTQTSDNNVRFNINNFGMVFTNAPKGKRYERRKWKSVAFGFGMNRVADFNRNYSYNGVNTNNSATLAFEADANQYPNDPGSTQPLTVPGYIGFQSYLLNQNSNGKYYSVVPIGGGVQQNKTVREKGRITEYAISLGANYMEKLMLGATLGLPTIKYSVNSTFSESLAPGNNNPNPASFVSFRYNQSLAITGNGVNLKLGGIYKLSDEFRIGAAFHTPTAYALSDTYTPGITSNVNNTTIQLSTANASVATDKFNYTFVSPWRGILSGSYIMKGKGFITMDYEYVGYNSMGYIYPEDDGSGYSYATAEYNMNQNLTQMYQNTSNVRIGVEALVTKFFMARAGFGYYGNPYKATGVNGQRMDFSGGIGFRDKEFFADIAFVHSSYQLQTVPYSIDYNYVVSNSVSAVPMANTAYRLNNVAVTIGVKF